MKLGLGLGLTLSGGGASFSVSIGSGPFTSGDSLTATVDGLVGGETVTYQWTDDGTNITGATASTYAPTIGTAGVADASLIGVTVTIDSEPYSSAARQIRYAAGSAPTIAAQTWTVGVAVNLDAAATGANLTFSYAATGLPAGLAINTSTGAITGTPTAATAGSATVTATDQYGREVGYSIAWFIVDAVAESFQFTLETTTTNESFQITFSPTADPADDWDAVLDWGDGSPLEHITDNTARSNTFATAGTQTVTVHGSLPNIRFADSPDKAKVRTVTYFKAGPWRSVSSGFYGCSGLTSFNAAGGDWSLCRSASDFLRETAIGSLDLTGITMPQADTLASFIRDNTTITSLTAPNLVTSTTTNVGAFAEGCTALQDIVGLETWDASGFTSAADFLTSVTLPTSRYDDTLIAWGAQSVQSLGAISFGSSTYTSAAASARQTLVNAGWVITDGGESSFNLSETLDGEIEITGGQPTSITITSPAYYAGTYTTDVNGTALSAVDFTAGPACIIAPLIKQTVDADSSSTINEGDTVGIGTPDATSYPGVWLYDTDNGAPTITNQWQADTGGNGTFANITGTSTTVVLTANEAGDDVRLQETATDTGGARTANSNALSVAAGATAYSFTDDFSTGYTANDDVPTVSANWSYIEGSAGGAQTATISNPVGDLVMGSSGSNGSTTIFHEDGGAIANDQVAQITLAGNMPSGGAAIFAVCRGADASNFAQFGYSFSSNTWLLHERVTGTTTTLDSDTVTAAPGSGDIISLEISGTTATGKLNGATVCTGTLASLTTGKTGIRFFAQNGRSLQMSEFTGGDL